MKVSELVADIRVLAEKFPDRIGSSGGHEIDPCVYVHDGQPSCIVGHALWGRGLIDAEWEHRTKSPDGVSWNEEDAQTVSDFLGIEADKDEAVWWVSNVQIQQDSGFPWAEAVRRTDERFERLVENGGV